MTTVHGFDEMFLLRKKERIFAHPEMAEDARGEPSSLKGPLAEVFVEGLLNGENGPLLRRLGNRAKVVDPVEGRAAGLAQLEPSLERIRERLAIGVFEKVKMMRGLERDIAEGVLTYSQKSEKVRVPIATLVQRGRAREVELRLYYSSKLLHHTGGRAAPIDADPELFLPKVALDTVNAMIAGKVDTVLAQFEAQSQLVDSAGVAHDRASGSLADMLKKFCAGGFGFEKCGTADDGRSFAIEGNVTKIAGRDVATHPMLFVFERGESGLFQEVRVYRDEI